VVTGDGGVGGLTGTETTRMSEELVDVIDELDRVVATVTRSRVRAEHLLHRVASVLVFRPDGRLLVHRRTDTKDVFPGAFDCFVSGVVTAGEGYEEARDRELREEMGIEGAGAVELFRHRYEGIDDRSWSAIFAITWDGPVVPQVAEIAWHGWEPVARVLRRVEEPTFVPDGREVLLRWLGEGARLPPGTVGSLA
jgi:isopentenyldiphosphate isomerase